MAKCLLMAVRLNHCARDDGCPREEVAIRAYGELDIPVEFLALAGLSVVARVDDCCSL
jgi:hypothetical protein